MFGDERCHGTGGVPGGMLQKHRHAAEIKGCFFEHHRFCCRRRKKCFFRYRNPFACGVCQHRLSPEITGIGSVNRKLGWMQEDFLKPAASQCMVMMGMTENDRDRERGDLADHGGNIIDTVTCIKEHGAVLAGQ